MYRVINLTIGISICDYFIWNDIGIWRTCFDAKNTRDLQNKHNSLFHSRIPLTTWKSRLSD